MRRALGASWNRVGGWWLCSQVTWKVDVLVPRLVGKPVGTRFRNSGFWVPPQPVEATDDAFWDQFWADTATSVQDVFALVPAAEIRAVREESPSNLATLCYKVRAA